MPERLSKVWGAIAPKLGGCGILLFLDYDGTLTPIVKRPERALLSRRVKQLLKTLSRQNRVWIVLVSGRSVLNLKKLILLPGILYVGNHGLEMAGPKWRYVHPGALRAKALLRRMSERLTRVFSSMPGILVENKQYTLSVHYRRLKTDKIQSAKRLLMEEIAPCLNRSQAILAEGKKVWEIRPPVKWNKGKAVLKLIGRIKAQSAGPFSIFYVGDDQTDEDAFKALKGRAVTIKVMSAPQQITKADYFLKSPREVISFLEQVKKNNRNKEKRKYGK